MQCEIIKYIQRVKVQRPSVHYKNPDGTPLMEWVSDYVKREWRLGRGPCGRNVVSLHAEVDARYLEIRQACKDHAEGQYDVFLIPVSDIEGAIQMFSPLN